MTTLTSEASKEADDLGYKFCNQTQGRVWAAIGFEKNKDWVSRGWWSLDPGVCAKVIKDALTQANYYVHAARSQASKAVFRSALDHLFSPTILSEPVIDRTW